MPSIILPGVSDVAIATVDELLAFSALPYYQVSGILKATEGEVVVGDPVAWDSSAKRFIKYDAGEAAEVDEAVGSGDGTQILWFLANDYIKAESLVVKVAAAVKTEGVDFIANYDEGWIEFVVAPASAQAITASYSHYANVGTAAGTAIGFVRIPGDATTVEKAIEVVIGGAVKYSVVSARTNWVDRILVDLKANYFAMSDAVIF